MDAIDDQVLDLLREFVYAEDWKAEALTRLRDRNQSRFRGRRSTAPR